MPPRPAGPRRRVLFLPAWHDEDVLHGVAEVAGREGWVLDAPGRRHWQVPRDWHGDGIIASWSPRLADLQGFLQRQQGIPTVFLSVPDREPADMVLRDEERILELGVQHLLRCGYDHLVFVSVHEDYFSRVRGQSFRDLLQRLGVAGGLLRIPGQDQPQATALACLREALGPVQGRIGLIAAQDGIAAQVLDLVLALQWTVPGQVGILGIDNDPLVCDFQAVSLSSIDNDRAGVGRAAARRLADRMRGVPPGCRVLVPPVGVVSRASTATGPHATGAGAGAGEPSLVDQARQVMEHHLADSGLSVDLVARSLGRSRRGLHDAFQRELGTSVGAEIARMRIALAQTLLKSTALPQAEIARRCGYSSAEALARLLRRELGQAPGRLRGKITPPA